MKTTRDVKKYVPVTENVFCNKCGKEIDFKHENYFEIHDQFFYGSKRDGDIIDMDLCQDCMQKFCESCKIDPIIESDIF